jgi:uncharacterized membrane protein
MDELTRYQLALFFHLLGALLFVAGIILAGVAFEAARRRQRPADIALLLALTRVGVALVGIGALLVLGFGLWLVHLGGFGYGAGWIDAAIVLYLAALALGAIGGRRPKQARRLATPRRRGCACQRRTSRATQRPPLARSQLHIRGGRPGNPGADGLPAVRRMAACSGTVSPMTAVGEILDVMPLMPFRISPAGSRWLSATRRPPVAGRGMDVRIRVRGCDVCRTRTLVW